MRQPWRDTPRAVSSPLPIPSSPSSDETDTGLMFAMSFSESCDDSDLSPQTDQLGHSLHPNVLFHRARQQSARGGIGSARADAALYNSIKKRPQTVQPFYSFPEPSSALQPNHDPSTSPDSPLSARWPANNSSLKRNSGPTHFRRYNPISQSSDDYYRVATKHTAYSSTDGDEDEEDDAECTSSDTNDLELSDRPVSPHLSRGNYSVHVPSTQFDIKSTFKNDDHHRTTYHPKNLQPGHSQRRKAGDTLPQAADEPYVAVLHANNKFNAHIYSPPVQLPSSTRHSRHRSTHDILLSTPRLESSVQPSQNRQQQQQSTPPKAGAPSKMTRPRSNTGSGHQYMSAPRHPLMSKVTATSYVSSSTLVPPGLGSTLKTDSQSIATSFRKLRI